MPAALPSRAAADGLARPVGRRGWVTWDMPEGCNSPKVHGSSRVLFSGMLLLLYGLLAPLALSLSRAHLPLPTKFLISREPQRAGCRAVVGPCLPRNWEPCMPEARDPR